MKGIYQRVDRGVGVWGKIKLVGFYIFSNWRNDFFSVQNWFVSCAAYIIKCRRQFFLDLKRSRQAYWSYIQSRECRSRAALGWAASDEERVPEIHFQNRKTSLQQQNQSTLMTKKATRTITVTRGIHMKKGSQHMRKAPMRKTSVIEAFASFDIISGSVLRARLWWRYKCWLATVTKVYSVIVL